MDLEWIRKVRLVLPGATESVQWGNDLVFKVHGKIFAVASLEPSGSALTLKCTIEEFADLSERPDCTPARYLPRGQWITLQTFDALVARETQRLLSQSYDLVVSKLPRKARPA
ncbi:MAG: MmcQ/YjbR family DNA-binding protein [Bryobacteraceae bacterium]